MDFLKEKQEAVDAGVRALESLREARKELSGAKGFGLWDIFGGGFFVSLAKHYKITKARNALEKAKWDLQCFRNELSDISGIANINIEIGDLLTFFDLWDNWIADILVQSRLADATNRIDQAITEVENILIKIS